MTTTRSKTKDQASSLLHKKLAPEYNIKYITHTEMRDNKTRPREGSFVEFELKSSEHKSTHTHIFCSLKKDKLFARGGFGVIREFSRFDAKEVRSIDGMRDSLSDVKSIAVKKMVSESYDIESQARIYIRNHTGLDIERSAKVCREMYGFGECTQDKDGNSYQFCQFFEGKPLGFLLKELEEYSEDKARTFKKNEYVKIVLAIIEALERFHKKEYVHGDFHELNIILIKQVDKWIANIIDFDYTRKHDQRLSLAWRILGMYKASQYAPEINEIACCTKASYSHDIFSLGTIISRTSNVISRSPQHHHEAAYLRLLGRQVARNDPEKRPDLETIKNQLKKYLESQEEKPNFALSKKLLWLFLTEQVRLLTLQEKKGSKGAKEKKERFSEILNELSSHSLNEVTLQNLIMKTAIVSHHRRKRSRDQFMHAALGLFTLGIGYCYYYNSFVSDSWTMWRTIEFPPGTSYAAEHQASLEDNKREHPKMGGQII